MCLSAIYFKHRLSRNISKFRQDASSYWVLNITSSLKKNPCLLHMIAMEGRWLKKTMLSSSMTARTRWATTMIVDLIRNQRFYNPPNFFAFDKSVMLYCPLNEINFLFVFLGYHIMNMEIRSFPPSFISQYQFRWYIKVLVCNKMNDVLHQQISVVPTITADIMMNHEKTATKFWK